MFDNLGAKFYLDFIEKERWRYLTEGLKITMIVTAMALVIGLFIGIIMAIIRTSHDQLEGENPQGIGWTFLKIANFFANIYLTVIRGTPALVQLLLIYFVFLVKSNSKVFVATVSFGINSGAYVAEIFRRHHVHRQGTDGGGAFPGSSLLEDHGEDHPAPGHQECAAGAGEREHHPVKGDLHLRLYRPERAHQRRRHHPRHHL